jgi:hypothetical protein
MMMIGGIGAYFHKRRGGEWTMASIKESAQEWMRSLHLDKLLGDKAEQGRSRNPSDDSGGSRRGSRNEAGEHGLRENRNGSGGMGSGGSGGSGGMGRH